jgi:hypothetical protein
MSGARSVLAIGLLFIPLAALATVPWLAARRWRGATLWFAAALIPAVLTGAGTIVALPVCAITSLPGKSRNCSVWIRKR